jgi:hypothetical protein
LSSGLVDEGDGLPDVGDGGVFGCWWDGAGESTEQVGGV